MVSEADLRYVEHLVLTYLWSSTKNNTHKQNNKHQHQQRTPV